MLSFFMVLIGLVVFIVGIFKLLVDVFKKRSKKQSTIIFLTGFVIFFIGILTIGDPDETKKATTTSSSVAATEQTNSSETKKETTKKEEDKVYNIGDTIDVKGYKIKVNSIEYSDGNEYSKPDNGKQFAIINITITNNTGKKASFNPLDYSINEDGVSTSTGFTYLNGVNTLSSGDLDNGASVTGNLVVQVNSNAKLKLRYEGNFFLQNEEIDINLN